MNDIRKCIYLFIYYSKIHIQESIQWIEEPVAYPGFFFEGGGQQIQLRTEDRDLGVVAP